MGNRNFMCSLVEHDKSCVASRPGVKSFTSRRFFYEGLDGESGIHYSLKI